MTSKRAWWADAACRNSADPGVFFPARGSGYGPARVVCVGCPVREPCLHTALDDERGQPVHARHGMYGGLTPEERYRLGRRRRSSSLAVPLQVD